MASNAETVYIYHGTTTLWKDVCVARKVKANILWKQVLNQRMYLLHLRETLNTFTDSVCANRGVKCQ